MGIYNGDNSANVVDLRGVPLGSGETAHSSSLMAGNDTFYGSSFKDIVRGGDGDDLIYGFGGGDIIIGDAGNDTLLGGSGDDTITGGTGNDVLAGEIGDDWLFGGTGDDYYVHRGAGEGIDLINDDKNEAGSAGYGGGADTVYLGYNAADIAYLRPAGSNNLWLGTATDLSDGVLSEGFIIENFFSSINNRIEFLDTLDGWTYDLSFIV